jgi:hypothetical protein
MTTTPTPMPLCGAASSTAALIEASQRLIAASREERARVCIAYGHLPSVATVAPVEVPPASWEQARDAEQQRIGRGVWKYFAT